MQLILTGQRCVAGSASGARCTTHSSAVSVVTRSRSGRDARNQYDAVAALACARRRSDATRRYGVDTPSCGSPLPEVQVVACAIMGEDRTCSSGDMFARTDTRTDTLITILRHHITNSFLGRRSSTVERPSTQTTAAATYLRLLQTISENSFICQPKRLVTLLNV